MWEAGCEACFPTTFRTTQVPQGVRPKKTITQEFYSASRQGARPEWWDGTL